MKNVAREALFSLYVIKGLPIYKVADELGIATGTAYNYIKRYGIETRTKSQANKGKTHTLKTRAAISKANKGKKMSEETRKKIADGHKNGGIGHKKKRNDGYISIYFPDHPKSAKDGYIMEHVLVMECLIGRHLYDGEIVHHINRNRADNRKENLQLMTVSEHAAMHGRERHEERMKNK